jgi:hypothetical protein
VFAESANRVASSYLLRGPSPRKPRGAVVALARWLRLRCDRPRTDPPGVAARPHGHGDRAYPERIAVPDSDRLIRVSAEVRDQKSIAAALAGQQIVLSGLGNVSGGDKSGALTAGARAGPPARPGPSPEHC